MGAGVGERVVVVGVGAGKDERVVVAVVVVVDRTEVGPCEPPGIEVIGVAAGIGVLEEGHICSRLMNASKPNDEHIDDAEMHVVSLC